MIDFELTIEITGSQPATCQDCGAELKPMGYDDDLRCSSNCVWKKYWKERKDK